MDFVLTPEEVPWPPGVPGLLHGGLWELCLRGLRAFGHGDLRASHAIVGEVCFLSAAPDAWPLFLLLSEEVPGKAKKEETLDCVGLCVGELCTSGSGDV